ncbi:cubilin-like isoform X2 [Tenebrio molitor]|uniref:cubilin-like isoform X2 n=1 Tax=Tenebrio molitor TaxID=7067 RepID=UPI0036248EBB
MSIRSVYFYTFFNFVTSIEYYGPVPRIIAQDGNLIFYAAEHKNISLQTQGRGGIHVNGIDLHQAAKTANSAFEAMKKYQISFESSFKRLSEVEQLLDHQSFPKISNKANTSSEIPVNSLSVVRSVRRLNRRVTALQRTVRSLTLLLNIDECNSNPCKNGGSCQDLFGDFLCHCPSEWEGPLCQKDVNECARFAGTDLGCQNGATCLNKPGSYECLCPHGWFGIHCTRRSTDCNSGPTRELCGHGTCITQYNEVGYKCICDQGWTTDGKTPACNTDVDECTMNKPPCSVNPLVQCINLPGSFHCGNCPAGYTGNGYYCTDIDECTIFNGGCSTNPLVQCVNTLGSRICGSCPPGYTGDGVTCSYQGVCSVNNGGCHRLATCRNNPRISSTFVQCSCPAGYVGNGLGPNGCVRLIQPVLNACNPNPCRRGSCRLNGTNDYTCDCYRRYTGKNCDSFKNLCASNPCLNGATCTSIFGASIRCSCTSSYTGSRCENEKQACGGRLTTETGVLTFPSGVFKTYANLISCAWTIETNVTKVLNITFKRFSVEDSHSCRYDWLQIHDGKNTLARSFGRFCGNNLPNGGVIISTHNIVYLWFRSDQAVSGGGFELTWNSIVPFCGEELKEVTTHGTIQSPGSPGTYPNNRDCYWPLQAPPGKRLLFHFFTLMIGNDSNCDHDYLEFATGTEPQDPVFAKFCNTSHPSPQYSPSSEVLIHFHSDSSQTYPGFQITYSVVEGMPGCGGVYTGHQGEIRSPSFDGRYPNDIQCEYKIQLSQESRIKITFVSFSIEDSENCQFDYVAVYAGSTVDAPLIGKYCGSNLPSPYVTETNTLLIVFTTDWATSEGGFIIKYETVCGGILFDSSGVLQSPGYPNRYSNSLECVYEIVQPLGKIIKLEFTDLDLETNSSPDCIYDFVEVRDGHDQNSTLLGTYCDRIPSLIVSSYNYLWIRFQTDSNNGGRGFKANYTTVSLGCGGIMKNNTGTFSTPQYPNSYPPGQVCKWIIAATPGHVIQILWMNFQLEKSYECMYDYVEIFDNNTETGHGYSIGKYCGHTAPPMLLSTSNLVTIVFRTDGTYHLVGFLATYNIIAEKDVCGGNYYTDAGTLKSPGYPNNYPLNMECTWTIQVKPGHQIMLNVIDFSLESYSVCRYDWVEIRNGGTSVSPLLGRYCGNTIPKMIPSHANKVYIRFRSDMTRAEKGFKISWSATATGCGGSLNGPTGSIISPNYPEPYSINTECIWKISISTGSLIQVVFSDLDLEEHSSCSLDYVEILDGPALNSKSLGKFCSSNPNLIRSTSNSLTVKFRSDLSRTGRGFQLQYTTICNNTLKGFRGVIESPNFPNVYPTSVNCNWEIEVANRNKINISFSHFDLEKVIPYSTNNSNKCIYDFIEVLFITPVEEYEEEGPFEKYGVYCGDTIPSLISLNSNHAKIHFVSDNLVHGNGFRLEWQIDGCGDVLTKPNGTITSPNYPKAYPPSVECNWKIEVDYGNQIEITFHKVDVEKTYLCHLDFIKLYNGEDETYPEIATVCHQNKPLTLRSSGNFMFVKFRADTSVQGLGFYANYTTKPTKCGGKYVMDKASIMSPNYPQNYDINSTCGYEIEVGEGHVISLKFEDFDLFEPNINCSFNNNSYVKVYDGPSKDYPLLAKICGKKAPNDTLLSTTNKLYLELVTDTATVAKGFLAKYRQNCGARIETDTTGIIRINPHDLDYDETNCSWTIVAKDLTKHISLTITHLDTMNSYCDENSKSLRIFNGETPDAPVLGEYCGTKIPPTLTSDGSAMHILIEYNSVLFATYSVFDSVCGGTLTSLEGFFASPGYPKKYPMETECEWTIEITEGNHVSLSFVYFELLESDHCNTDYLEIRQNNGTGKLLGTFCGTDLPTNISNVGSLWIYLKTSRMEGDVSTVSAKGFYAEYILNHDNELSGPSGTIVSPLYSQQFPLYGDFSWKISVNFGKRILLTFKELYVENGDGMCFSEIDVYDGGDSDTPNLGSFCGTDTPDAVRSSSNIMLVKFSGYSSTRSLTRFILEWTEVNVNAPNKNSANKTKTCGTSEPLNINSLKNYTKISSPGFPNGYGPNQNCEWVFTTIQMNSIKMYIGEMDLTPGYGSRCYGDYVEIFEKKINADWTSLLKTCHANVTRSPPIVSSNMMKVVFKSDGYGNRTGFEAIVREDCGGILRDRTGFIVYNNETRIGYGSKYLTKCQWNITVRAGRTIEIEFLNFFIHSPANKPCSNYLMIRNGQFPDSPILGQGKYCGEVLPPKLTTTSNNAYLKYTGVHNVANFELRYREVSHSCGGEIALTSFANSTIIMSPNYPNIPPAHVECSWRIRGPPGEVLRIDFIDRFDLTFVDQCSKEYVELRDGGTEHSKVIGKYCDVPNSQFTTDNMMFVKFYTELNDPSNGFKARITLANCGGTVRARIGQIQSPFFNRPSKYPIGVNCTWHLVSPLDHSMTIKFKKIDLPGNNNCISDHVTIYEDNFDNKSRVLGTYCGSKLPDSIKTSGNEAVVRFITTKVQKHNLNGFSLEFQASLETCGGTIEASEGTIKSPDYPAPHKSYRRCSWFIKVPKGRRVTLKIIDIDLDNRLSGTWVTGLSIYNYEHHKGFIKKITSTDKIVESTENHMFVFYWSPGRTGRGFKVKFTSNEPTACEGDLNQDNGVITQPKVNFAYYCSYDRNRPPSPGTTLAMTVTVVTNATKPGTKTFCNTYYGFIKVTTEDEKNDIEMINCMPTKTTIIRSPYPNVKLQTLQFSSRYQLNYTISFNTYKCGGIITSETGSIKSPGYPNKYSKSMECSWLIQLPKDQTILLTFDALDLGNDCEKSYLDIFNGNSPKSPKIDRYCQSNLPEPLSSQSNTLWINYKFDQTSNSKGFSFKYEPKIQGCGGVYHDRTRIIQSPSFPNDYPNNAECLWELRSDDGYHLGLIFTNRFQIEQSENCENDFLEIWDWKDNGWVSLGKKCGRDVPNTLNSTSNRVKLLFRSNEKITGKGFRIRWEWNCGGSFTADKTEKFIVSPGYPLPYGKNMNCQYNISGIKESYFVNVKFYHFDLEGTGSRCMYDNLTVTNIWRRGNFRRHPLYNQVFCGQKSPPEIRLSSTIFIQFFTDNWVQKTGYKFSYQLDNCGGDIDSPTSISTPAMNRARHPGLYQGYISCVWNITAPPKKNIVIRFQQFHFEYRRNCYFDNVEIFEGSTILRSKRIANLCGDLSKNLPVITSESNAVVISMRTDRTLNHTGFQAEVIFSDGTAAGCGGKVYLNKSMTLTAPNLPDMDCSWLIQSDVGTSIKIRFDELNLPATCPLGNHTTTNCSCGSLQITDGHPAASEIIEKFCGITSTNFARQLSSISNSLGIRLHTRGSNSKAFKVILTPVNTICGPVFLNVSDQIQTVTSPGYPNKYPSDLRCLWVLTAPRKFVVHFVDFELNEENNQHVVTNICKEDRVEIVDDLNTNVLSNDLGPSFTFSGNRKVTADFSRFSLMPGDHHFCGKSDKPFDYYSGLNILLIKFTSGNIDRNRGKGFKIEYQTIGCNRNFTSLQGRIVNTFSENCYQTIIVPENYTISLFFNNFVLYQSSGCDQVGVEIRDGADHSANLLQKSCGYAIPNPVFSTKNKLWIHSWNKMGFKLPSHFDVVYTSSDKGRGCGGTLYNYKGTFSSPSYPLGYKGSTPCVWDVRVPIGMRVAIKFSVFDIQGDCKNNYVKVTTYDKDSSNDHKFCKEDNPAVLYSNSRLTVTYQSSSNNGGTGWIALFESVHQ